MFRRKDGLFQEKLTYQLNGAPQKPRYFYGKTKKEVLEKIADFKRQLAAGRLFEVIAWEWLDQADISAKTEQTYRTVAGQLCDHFGKTPMRQISPAEVAAFIKSISDGRYARRTVQMRVDLLRMIFDYAIFCGDATANPVVAIKLSKRLHVGHRQLAPDASIRAIRDHVEDDFGLFAFFLLYSGLRPGELLGLRWDDVDIEGRLIHVRRAVSYPGNQPVIKEPKTAAGKRDVILLEPLAAKLTPGKGYLFGGDKPLTKTQYRKRWARYAAAAGVEAIPYQLRHEFATICLDAGLDAKDAQQLLGHTSVTTTLNIYTHIRKSREALSAQRLNDYLATQG